MKQLLSKTAAPSVVLALGTLAPLSNATPVAVDELGNARSAAFKLNGFFSAPATADVFGSLPTASPRSTLFGSGDVDWYSFDALAGSAAYFDVDNKPATVDTVLSLFDSNGTLLAYGDDSTPVDPGSENVLDSFLGVVTLAMPGTYYLAVSGYPNYPARASTGSFRDLTRPDGEKRGGFLEVDATDFGDDSFNAGGGAGEYNLHVSVSAPVPDDSTTFELIGVGLLGLFLFGLKQHRHSA